METTMKELNMEELEQVNGGEVIICTGWLIAAGIMAALEGGAAWYIFSK